MTKKQFFIPKLNGLKSTSSTPKTTFIIPNLFNKNSQDDATKKKPNFIIPSFGKPMTLPNLGTSPSNKEFKSLSEVVSNHLDSQISALNAELKNTTLDDDLKNDIFEEELNTQIIEKINQISIVKEEPLLCSFDAQDLNLFAIKIKLKKSRSKFAKVLCRSYKRSLNTKLSVNKQSLPKKIKLFNFDTPSPDDGIKRHLKR